MTKTKRLREHAELEREVIKVIYLQVRDCPDDGRWRKFEQDITFRGIPYTVTCRFKVDNTMLTYENLLITHKQKVIEIINTPELLH